jgi:DNA modification methylase
MIQGENYTVHIGNSLDILPTLADNSVDSIVTDPPYELGFMGKKWDSSGIAYSVELWRECLRVLKPGGHLLSFGGTRTYHRVAVAIEDAGFEIRDSIAWIYGSGFPKSLDVSKAIDKRGGSGALLTKEIGEALRVARESRGMSKSKADEIFCDGTTNWTWFEGRPAGQRPPTPETFARIVAEWPELSELSEKVAEAEREVIGKTEATYGYQRDGERWDKEHFVTASATDEAKRWEGWGTALKPAHEPVVVGRKPFGKGVTVAENVLLWGVGGLNIDGSRIAMDSKDAKASKNNWNSQGYESKENIYDIGTKIIATEQNPQGRWPANVILDEYSAELLDEQSGERKGMATQRNSQGTKIYGGNSLNESKTEFSEIRQGYNDTGGASRFFYVAKASKRDRNEGLENSNSHPTVKPTQLMRYLVKLVTPPNGTVLDPFTGSGSTGKAAILEGFRFIGIELTEDYIPIIKGRLEFIENKLFI